MAETTIPGYSRGATFEDVWAAMMEERARFEQTGKLLDQTGKLLDQTRKLVEENSRQIGGLHRSFGELAEHLVAPSINRRFNELGYHFGSVLPGGLRIEDEQGKVKTEIDLLLENGDTIMAVEVKAKPGVKDVEHHIKRLEILRDYRRGINDSRKIQGAIAGAIFGATEKKAVIEAGLYALEQSGDTMKISVPHDFVPQDW